MIWLGVLQEFGVDTAPTTEFEDDTDNRAFKDKVWDDLEDRQASRSESTDGPTECDVCGFKAKSPFGLIAHKRSHRNDDVDQKKKKAVEGVTE